MKKKFRVVEKNVNLTFLSRILCRVSNPGLLMGLPLPVFAKEPDRTPQPNSTFADSSNMDSFFNINNGGSFTVNRAHQAIVHHSDGTHFFSKVRHEFSIGIRFHC